MVAARRFDTDTLLEQVLEGNGDAFRSFYERYRGRVYRFIVRLCGNGVEGQAAYLSVWARFAASHRKCKDKKALKFAFFKSLESPLLQSRKLTCDAAPMTMLPKGLEEEGGWSVVLVDLVKRLPDGLRKRFLFRYEIGLSENAISQIFGERVDVIAGYIREAERELLEGLSNAGCTKRVSLEALYRETRFLQPPASWDENILNGYLRWLEKGVPRSLLKSPVVHKDSGGALGGLFGRALGRLRPAPMRKHAHLGTTG